MKYNFIHPATQTSPVYLHEDETPEMYRHLHNFYLFTMKNIHKEAGLSHESHKPSIPNTSLQRGWNLGGLKALAPKYSH